MGSSVYPCLIRVKARAPEPSATPDFVLLGVSLAYEQLEFLNIHDDDWDPIEEANDIDWQHHRGPVGKYDMFGALVGGAYSGPLPILDDAQELHEVTKPMIAWLNNAREVEYLKTHLGSKGFSDASGLDSFEDDYLLYGGGYRTTILDLARLQAFDYDQPVKVKPPDPEYEIGDQLYLDRCARYAGKVYRDLMPREWFNFLQWTKKENWHYLLCQFD